MTVEIKICIILISFMLVVGIVLIIKIIKYFNELEKEAQKINRFNEKLMRYLLINDMDLYEEIFLVKENNDDQQRKSKTDN